MKKYVKWIFLVLLACIVALSFAAYTPDANMDFLLEKYSYEDSRFLDDEGMAVHYRDVGQGPPLVLLHGTSASLHTWEEWVSVLSPHFRVISVDIPGFGLTGPFVEHDDYTMEAYVTWLHRFLQKIGIESPSLAGNSFGGNLAWRYAVAHPQNVNRLILIDPSGFPLDPSAVLGFRLAGSPIFSWVVSVFTPYWVVNASVVRVYGRKNKVTNELVTRYRDLTLRPGNRTALVKRIKSINWSNTEMVRDVKAPVLLMWGTHDELIPFEKHSHHFMAALPDAKLIAYRGVGHMPMEEIPIRSSQDALAFLLAE